MASIMKKVKSLHFLRKKNKLQEIETENSTSSKKPKQEENSTRRSTLTSGTRNRSSPGSTTIFTSQINLDIRNTQQLTWFNDDLHPHVNRNVENLNQQRPPVITPNPNFNAQRPPAIQPNPNYFRQNNNNRKTFHLNQNNEQEVYEQPNQNYYENTSDSYYTGNNAHTDTNYYPANNSEYYNNEDYYTANGPSENYYTEEPNYNTTLVYDQDFQLGPPPLSDPPDHNRDSNTAILQTQFGNMNLDNFNPNLNFPEQRFL
ncbi:hypothetical protein NQ318_008497 [Aromia moschata]|uniref:GATA zinc finger domain-containing protein 14-like n=1 Tax=Aromia moschata TaxID=1265417 RepID=A0AAV8XCB9_9CUCU|nr:hypothetical protein NQ318_008497 [Aromia moschata]